MKMAQLTGYDVLSKLPDEIKSKAFDAIVDKIRQSDKMGKNNYTGYDIVQMLLTLVDMYK